MCGDAWIGESSSSCRCSENTQTLRWGSVHKETECYITRPETAGRSLGNHSRGPSNPTGLCTEDPQKWVLSSNKDRSALRDVSLNTHSYGVYQTSSRFTISGMKPVFVCLTYVFIRVIAIADVEAGCSDVFRDTRGLNWKSLKRFRSP